MTMKKAGLAGVLIAAVAVALLATRYIGQWREPKAKYEATDNPALARIREELTGLKADLKRKGVYSCCIRNDCNWCAIYMGHCPCAEMVMEKGNEKSCPECAAAWNMKQGRIPGIDPEAIRVTTFGIYGYEGGGHHSPEAGGKDEGGNHGDEEERGN